MLTSWGVLKITSFKCITGKVERPKLYRKNTALVPYEPGSKLLVLGMVIQPLIGNPYNGYINPYYWVDDHPLLYGNNGSLDPSTYSYLVGGSSLFFATKCTFWSTFSMFFISSKVGQKQVINRVMGPLQMAL